MENNNYNKEEIIEKINILFPIWAEQYLDYLIENFISQEEYSFIKYLNDNNWIDKNL